MKNVLLLTDFSKNATNAIDYAIQLFSGEIRHFHILNVQRSSKYITSDLLTSPHKTVHDAVIKNPQKKLKLLIDGLKKKYNDEDYIFEGMCDYNTFLSSVNQTINLKKIDFIVMGTNGVSGIKETVFGSNTIQIIKSVDLPILVIPENYKYAKPENILFINEINEIIDANIIKPLSSIISKFNSHLDVLTIENYTEQVKPDRIKENIIGYFNDVHLNFIEMGEMTIEEAIECLVIKNEIKLVSKIVNTKTFFERIFSKSNTTNITYASKVPLLFL